MRKSANTAIDRAAYQLNILRLQLILSLTGVCITWMLSFTEVAQVNLPCGGATDCATIAQSSAAKIGSLPTAVIGLLFYSVMSVYTSAHLLGKRLIGKLLIPHVAMVAAVVSTVLTAYSHFVLGLHCVWCMSSNLVACCLAFLATTDRTLAEELSANPQKFFVCTSAGITAAITAISAYLVVSQPAHIRMNSRSLASISANALVPPDALAVRFNADKPYAVLFIDLQCDECRQLLKRLMPRDLKRHSLNLVFHHLPHKLHFDSLSLAILVEEAHQAGVGIRYLAAVEAGETGSLREAQYEFKRLGIEESDSYILSARARIARDTELARELGILETPTILFVRSGMPATVLTEDQLMSLL